MFAKSIKIVKYVLSMNKQPVISGVFLEFFTIVLTSFCYHNNDI